MKAQSGVLILFAVMFIALMFIVTLQYVELLREYVMSESYYIQQVDNLRAQQDLMVQLVAKSANSMNLSITNVGTAIAKIIGVLLVENDSNQKIIYVIPESVTILPQQNVTIEVQYPNGFSSSNMIGYYVVTSLGLTFS